MDVDIIEDTNLIRVSLELPDSDEAVTIVQAVVQSYMAQNLDYSRSANRDLTDNYNHQLVKLGTEINEKKKALKELVKNGKIAVTKPEARLNTGKNNETDLAQPALRTVSEGQFEQIITEMVRTDHELEVAESRLETLQEAAVSKGGGRLGGVTAGGRGGSQVEDRGRIQQ